MVLVRAPRNLPSQSRRYEVARPNLGIFYDRARALIPERGLVEALNCRIRNGSIVRVNAGWSAWKDIQLNGPVLLIDSFRLRTGTTIEIFATPTDLYRYDPVSSTVAFITPTYGEAIVGVTNGSDQVVGFATDFDGGTPVNVKAGDEFHFGTAGQTDPDATWYEVESVEDEDHLTLTTEYAGTTTAGVYTIRRKFTGLTVDAWISDVFPDAQPDDADLWIATNGTQPPVKWDGNAVSASFMSLGFTCRWLRRWKGMMLYGDLTEASERKSNRIRNSALTDPNNVSTLEASEINGTDGTDTLLRGRALGDLFVAYGSNSFNLIYWVGPPVNFVVRQAYLGEVGRGAISPRAIIDRGDFHDVMTASGLKRFDGVSVQDTGVHVFREVARRMDLSRTHQTIGHLSPLDGEALWLVPMNGDESVTSAQIAFTEHYLEEVGGRGLPVDFKPIMRRELPATAIGFYERQEVDALRFDDLVQAFEVTDIPWNDRFFVSGFPTILFGDAEGFLYELGAEDAKNGLDLLSFARFARRRLANDGNQRGLVSRLEPYAKKLSGSTYDLGVRFYSDDFAEPSLVEIVPQERLWELSERGASDRWIAPRVLARYLELEFWTEGAQRGWELAGYGMEVVDGAAR